MRAFTTITAAFRPGKRRTASAAPSGSPRAEAIRTAVRLTPRESDTIAKSAGSPDVTSCQAAVRAGLIGADGRLIGIGSLHVQHANSRELRRDVNMVVPIDLLPPILDDMLTYGRPNRPARPWLGLYATAVEDAIVVAGLSERGPAIKTGLRPGDRILAVREDPVVSLAGLWRKIWATGPAGSEVVLQVRRDNETLTVRVLSVDRTQFLKAPKLH